MTLDQSYVWGGMEGKRERKEKSAKEARSTMEVLGPLFAKIMFFLNDRTPKKL